MKKLLGEIGTKTANAVNTAVKTVDKALTVEGSVPHSAQHTGDGRPSGAQERHQRYGTAGAHPPLQLRSDLTFTDRLD